MFDTEKARKDGISEYAISIMERVNMNAQCRTHCSGHDFRRVGNYVFLPGHKATVGKYRCRKCGYTTIIDYVRGYNDGLQHAANKKRSENDG